MDFKNKIKLGIVGASLLIPMAFSLNVMAQLTYKPISATSFESGTLTAGTTYYDWYIQSNPGAISRVTAPAGKGGYAAKVSINKSDNFSRVANGSPRAELQSKKTLYTGKSYIIEWKTFLPQDFKFDNPNNRELFMQVHQTSGDGSPPIEIGLSGNKYYYDSSAFGAPKTFSDASYDRGKWISWAMKYKPSATGGAVTDIYKNGKLLVSYTGRNVYPTGNGYMKMGIYKWDWRETAWPSYVTNRTIYFDDIVISEGTSTTTTTTTP